MKAVVAAFNQEKALVRAFSVITNLRMQFGWNSLKHYWAPVVHRHQHHVAVQQLVGPVHGVGAQHEGAAVDEDDDGERRGGAERGAEHREVEAVLGAAGLLPAASHLHALPGTQHIAQLARVQLTATTSGQRFEFARKLIVICVYDNSLMT